MSCLRHQHWLPSLLLLQGWSQLLLQQVPLLLLLLLLLGEQKGWQQHQQGAGSGWVGCGPGLQMTPP
jgi:hypothetical protein